jgi:hypothetical protein
MDASELRNLEPHQEMELMGRMSTSGQLQLYRTLYIPEVANLVEAHWANARNQDAAEFMVRGTEIKGEATLADYGLLGLFRRTQRFSEYPAARESCKRALTKLTTMQQARRLAGLSPATVEFDVEYFFFDFMPGRYEEALKFHQGTIADAAGRGDLAFFKRLYNKVKNDQDKKAGGQYEHFVTTFWLPGFLWLMPEKLACQVVANRMRRFFEAGEDAGLESRKHASDLKQEYETRVSGYEKFKAGVSDWFGMAPQFADGSQHEKERVRFRKAVKSLGLYQHPESPVIGTRKPGPGELSSACYVWKNGWPK